MSRENNYWAVIPAAGTGKRMQVEIPKQYLELAGKTVLQRTLSVFFQHPKITGIVVSIAQHDHYWEKLEWPDNKPLYKVNGGKERSDSVLNALNFLKLYADNEDWVLVHDAARPCLNMTDIDLLMDSFSDSECGGLLGLPMSDTVKRCNSSQKVLETVDRSDLWRALTPQMFRLGLLHQALNDAIANHLPITDEASAIEAQGLQPAIIKGTAQNIKITQPGDLDLAELYFEQLTNEK